MQAVFIILMGSRSKFHGLTGIKTRQKNKNPFVRERKERLTAAKKASTATLREKLAGTPEIA